MRVIHVTAYYAPAHVYGGPVRSIHALCKAQQALGIDVEVFTTNAAGRERLPAAPDGRDCDGVRVRYFDLSSPAFLLGSTEIGPALRRAIGGCDVVHVHGLFNRTVWDTAGVLHTAGTPYVLSPRGMLEPPALAHHRWRKLASWRLKDRAVVQRAAVLHATSSLEAATLRREYAGAQVVQVANAVSCPRPDAAGAERWRASLGLAPNAPIVLSLGRLHRIKRLDLVAAAFRHAHRQVPDARLIVAGPDEHQLRPALERQLGEAHDAARWLGPVGDADKVSLLTAADVLVQCSDSESFGMSVAEALALGTPVVVTRTCPWQEVEEYRCGFWVEQRSESIAQAMVAILEDPDGARTMGVAGQQLVQERMSPARVGEHWRAIYGDVARLKPVAA
jgi:glycosyltransferase involved in cell wall biosynthesis